MSVLDFTVIAVGGGQADFTLSSTLPGNTLVLGDGTYPTNSLTGDFAVITPEPSTAVLVGMSFLGLGVAGRRRN